MESCVFCHSPEGWVCSVCVQKLLLMGEDKLKKAYALALEKGFAEKAAVIEKLIDKEEEFYVPQTGKARTDMVRERPVRQTRLANREARA